METKYYIDVNDFASFLCALSDKVPKTPLTRNVVIKILDYVEQNMKPVNVCPFTTFEEEVCEVCRVEN